METLTQALNQRIRRDYGAEGLEDLFVRLDLLHASAGPSYAAGLRISSTPRARPCASSREV